MRSLALLLVLAACTRTPHPVSLDLPAGVQLASVPRAQADTLRHWLWFPEFEEEAPKEIVERCRAGEDVVGQLPLEVAAVVVAPGQPVWVGSEQVAHLLGDGSFPASTRRGQMLTPVYDALLNRAADQQAFRHPGYAPGCAPWVDPGEPPAWRGHVLLVLDERLPWETVRDLLYTTQQARFADVALLVDAPEPWPDSELSWSEELPPAIVSPPEGTPWATVATQAATQEEGHPLRFAHHPELEPVVVPIPATRAQEARSWPVDARVPVLRTWVSVYAP